MHCLLTSKDWAMNKKVPDLNLDLTSAMFLLDCLLTSQFPSISQLSYGVLICLAGFLLQGHSCEVFLKVQYKCSLCVCSFTWSFPFLQHNTLLTLFKSRTNEEAFKVN